LDFCKSFFKINELDLNNSNTQEVRHTKNLSHIYFWCRKILLRKLFKPKLIESSKTWSVSRYVCFYVCVHACLCVNENQIPLLGLYCFELTHNNVQNNRVQLLFYFFLRFYLFERKRERENEQGDGKREGPRDKQTPHWAGSPMRGSIPGPQDHDPSQSHTLNWLSHPGVPSPAFKGKHINYSQIVDINLAV